MMISIIQQNVVTRARLSRDRRNRQDPWTVNNTEPQIAQPIDQELQSVSAATDGDFTDDDNHQDNRHYYNRATSRSAGTREFDPNDPHISAALSTTGPVSNGGGSGRNEHYRLHSRPSIIITSDVVSEAAIPVASASHPTSRIAMAQVADTGARVEESNVHYGTESTVANPRIITQVDNASAAIEDPNRDPNTVEYHSAHNNRNMGLRSSNGGGGGDIDRDTIVTANEMPIAVANAVPSYWTALQPLAIPVPTTRPEHASEADIYERERVLMNLYHRSRFVRLMSLIDLCFVILFGAFIPFIFIVSVFPIMGYWGARKWKHRLLLAYVSFLGLEVVGNFWAMLFVFDAAFIIMHIMHIFLAIILGRYTLNLARYILVLNAADLDFLKNSTLIRTIEKRAIC